MNVFGAIRSLLLCVTNFFEEGVLGPGDFFDRNVFVLLTNDLFEFCTN